MTDDYLIYIDEYMRKANKLLKILSENKEKHEIQILEANLILRTAEHLKREYMRTYYPDYSTRWIKIS